jgi:hypothetical protein
MDICHARFSNKSDPLSHLNFDKTEDIFMNHASGDSQLAKEVPILNFLQILWSSKLGSYTSGPH